MKTVFATTTLFILLAAPALADYYERTRPRYSTRSYLSNRGIVGGRSVRSDDYRPYSYRPYGYSTRGYQRAPRERVIIIERDYSRPGRWR